jgi:uncharacterized protein (UPF0332 family)
MAPREFLDLADELLGGTREGDWRSAVSRAYYAAFHVARLLLDGCGFAVPHGEQAHRFLWLRLSNAGHPEVSQAGVDLEYLRRARNRADYDLHVPFPHPLAVAQVATALSIIQLLEELPALPAVLSKVIDAIRAYERDVLGEVSWRP